MRTLGVRMKVTRTRSLTWMSLCFRRAQVTCSQRCASWLFSTQSSRSSVCSATIVWRYGSLQPIAHFHGPFFLDCRTCGDLALLLGSSGGLQKGKGDRQEAWVWWFVHHWTTFWWWHQGSVGSARHQHSVSLWFRFGFGRAQLLIPRAKVLHCHFRSFPNNYWDKFIKRKVSMFMRVSVIIHWDSVHSIPVILSSGCFHSIVSTFKFTGF